MQIGATLITLSAMEYYNKDISIDGFFARVGLASQRVLMLDFDGTLAPFEKDRDKAKPYDGVEERLGNLMKSGHTRLIIISGRVIDDLKQLLDFDNYPEMWGVHGAQQYLPDENITRLVISRRVADDLIEAEKWAKKEQLTSFIEKKPAGLAFSWQGRTGEEKEKLQNAMKKFEKLNQIGTSLVLHEVDGGVEMKSDTISKEHAVKSILKDLPIDSAIAYLGDDLTDEAAFKVLKGRGLCVLVRSQNRATAADVRIDPPEELFDFLDRWANAH